MITYSTNFMGPVNIDWYRKRGLTHKVSKVLGEDRRFYPKGLGPGDVWEYDEITTHYAAGRIDIRGLDSEKYWNGWDEYGLAPMHGEDWNAFSDWLDELKTYEQITYEELIDQFEHYNGKSIRWSTGLLKGEDE